MPTPCVFLRDIGGRAARRFLDFRRQILGDERPDFLPKASSSALKVISIVASPFSLRVSCYSR